MPVNYPLIISLIISLISSIRTQPTSVYVGTV